MKEVFRKFFRAMNVEANETTMVFLLLSQSVFLGIFYGALDIASNSLFLGSFPAEMLPRAFTVSGLVGILMTSVYSTLQKKLPFRNLALINLFTVAALTILLWMGFSITNSKWHVFLLLVMMGL